MNDFNMELSFPTENTRKHAHLEEYKSDRVQEKTKPAPLRIEINVPANVPIDRISPFAWYFNIKNNKLFRNLQSDEKPDR